MNKTTYSRIENYMFSCMGDSAHAKVGGEKAYCFLTEYGFDAYKLEAAAAEFYDHLYQEVGSMYQKGNKELGRLLGEDNV